MVVCGRFNVVCLINTIILHSSGFLLANPASLSDVGRKRFLVATVKQGHVVGELKREAGIFWGIPFSQPPVGEYRWKNPRNPIPFKGKYYNATYKRPGCKQICYAPIIEKALLCPNKTSEDCLFLNIFVPRRLIKVSRSKSMILDQKYYLIPKKYRNSATKSLAVMVYLHGGSFKSGVGSAFLYDGRFLAHHGDVIVVTINYRLGPLGFLVEGSGNDAAKGNYGIRDQIKALEWVKNNIQHFGGNPKKITLFGQSAGAESIGILSTSPLGKGLFHKAIYESDSLSLPYRTLSGAKDFGDKMARELKCQPGNMTCLRKQDADAIIRAGNKVGKQSIFSAGKALYAFQPWGPVIDGNVMLSHPIKRFSKREFHRMPIIMGDNVNDANIFVNRAFRGRIPSFLYEMIVNVLGGDKSDAILKQYPECPSLTCDNKKTISKLATDYVFICAARKVLSYMGPLGWFYLFNATIPFKGHLGNKFCSTGVCHGAEVPYVFDSPLLKLFGAKESQLRLAGKMQYYWSNFAKYGDPNGFSEVNWSHRRAEYWSRFVDFDSSSYKAMEMTSHGNFMLTNPYKKECDFWDKLDLYGKL